MHNPLWIWQHPGWPRVTWQLGVLAPLLRMCAQAQGRLLGMAGAVNEAADAQHYLDSLLQNIVTSSAIEGEQLNVGSVRSSLARRLGMPDNGTPSPRSEGLAALLLDATGGYNQPLTLERLFTWHGWLFPSEEPMARIEKVLANARFWQAHRADDLAPEQIRVLNRLLDGGERGFEGGISAAQYQAVAKVSKATATRHLGSLLNKGCIVKLPGGGRSTRYHINAPASPAAR